MPAVFLVSLTVLLSVLKATGVIGIAWIWVLLPALLVLVAWALTFVVFFAALVGLYRFGR